MTPRNKRLGVVVLGLLLALISPGVSSGFEIKANLGAGSGFRLDPDASENPAFLTVDLHATLLWGRDENGQWAGGPDLFVLTDEFENLNAGAGASLLFPIHDRFPLLVTAAGFYRRDSGSDQAVGVLGRFWWGYHARNRESVYVGSLGIFVEPRVDLWGEDHIVLVVGVDLDALTLFGPLWSL